MSLLRTNIPLPLSRCDSTRNGQSHRAVDILHEHPPPPITASSSPPSFHYNSNFIPSRINSQSGQLVPNGRLWQRQSLWVAFVASCCWTQNQENPEDDLVAIRFLSLHKPFPLLYSSPLFGPPMKPKCSQESIVKENRPTTASFAFVATKDKSS